jgi:hypothetical protein
MKNGQGFLFKKINYMEQKHKNIILEKFGIEKGTKIIDRINNATEKMDLEEELYNQKITLNAKEVLSLAIPKEDLIDGEVYFGQCLRLGANSGKWNSKTEKFTVRRYKFGWYDFDIEHLEDEIDGHYDGFAPMKILEAE